MAFVNQLRQNGEEITDVCVMEKVLRSLNTKFEIIATMIEETQDLENMKIEQFIGSLQAYEEKKKRRMEQTETVEQLLQLKIKEENNRGHGRGRGGRGHGGKGKANTNISQNSSESSRGKGGRGRGRRGERFRRDKSQVKCYNCNKYRHYANECYSFQIESIDRKHQDRSTASTSKAHQGQSNYAEENGTLFMVSKGEEESQDSMWYLDTEALNHMCGKHEMFVELNETEKGNIAFGENSLAAIKGIGIRTFVNSPKDTATKWHGGEEESDNLEHGKKHAKDKEDVEEILGGGHSLCGLFDKSSTNQKCA
ncbi:uncharacterized protein LOC120077457 [Benincasa hispida]|uniref:uncharacterized protein LOC120077457 n=1 Tax=Benincasa hispida TaxID=102211 RepID=UPI0019017F67|nr:uncharacterized protein LOC120077457 [Benincasa hispida]